MANETATVEAPTSLLTTPPPVAVTPEAALFGKTTPGPDGKPPVAPPVAPTEPPPTAPSEPPKPPTEPIKPEVPTTPPSAPTEYDLKLPPDSPVSAEEQAVLVKESKAAGLTKEEAEEVLKSHDQVARSTATRIRSQVKAEQDKALSDAKILWKSTIEKDPVYGGEHLPETAGNASRAYHALTTPDERKEIESIGLDFHPIFTRMMAKVGRMMAEDKFIRGVEGEPPIDTRSAEAKAKILYGKTTPAA